MEIILHHFEWLYDCMAVYMLNTLDKLHRLDTLDTLNTTTWEFHESEVSDRPAHTRLFPAGTGWILSRDSQVVESV